MHLETGGAWLPGSLAGGPGMCSFLLPGQALLQARWKSESSASLAGPTPRPAPRPSALSADLGLELAPPVPQALSDPGHSTRGLFHHALCRDHQPGLAWPGAHTSAMTHVLHAHAAPDPQHKTLDVTLVAATQDAEVAPLTPGRAPGVGCSLGMKRGP